MKAVITFISVTWANLINKLTPKQALIAVLATIFVVGVVVGGVYIYKDYNATKVELARIAGGKD